MSKRIVFIFMLFFGNSPISNLFAQGIIKGTPVNVSPLLILIDGYTKIDLHENSNAFLLKNSFDSKNDATYILPITEETSTLFHILYQTDFSGKLNYLALSNNLLYRFHCENKSMIHFDLCVKKIDCSYFQDKCIDEVIECIIQRLKDCY